MIRLLRLCLATSRRSTDQAFNAGALLFMRAHRRSLADSPLFTERFRWRRGTSRSRETGPRERATGLESGRGIVASSTRRVPNGMTAMGAAPPRRGGWDFVGRDRELAELVAGLEDALG